MLRPGATERSGIDDRWTAVLEQAVSKVRGTWTETPKLGLLLGSGLGGLARAIRAEATFEYSQLPSFPHPTADGHCGRLVCGRLAGVAVVALVGRSHLYEGYTAAELALPIRLLRRLGAPRLVLTNASGGLNPRFQRGDVMVIRDHLCLQFLEIDESTSANFHCTQLGAPAYDPGLADWALDCARHGGMILRQGVYVAMTGPNYETRAEYRMVRNLGGDAVGMSTALEAVIAARLGMRTLGLSMIANVATPDRPQRVTHEEVLAAGALAEPVMQHIIERFAAATEQP